MRTEKTQTSPRSVYAAIPSAAPKMVRAGSPLLAVVTQLRK